MKIKKALDEFKKKKTFLFCNLKSENKKGTGWVLKKTFFCILQSITNYPSGASVKDTKSL